MKRPYICCYDSMSIATGTVTPDRLLRVDAEDWQDAVRQLRVQCHRESEKLLPAYTVRISRKSLKEGRGWL